MMISVLMFSRSPGLTGWAAVRGSKVIRGKGLQPGDLLRIDLRGNGHSGVSFFLREEEGEFGIPEGVELVRVEHLKVSGNPVYVDLEV